MLAIVVNDNACFQNKRGVLETIASKLAPTGFGVYSESCGSWLASDGGFGIAIASKPAPTNERDL